MKTLNKLLPDWPFPFAKRKDRSKDFLEMLSVAHILNNNESCTDYGSVDTHSRYVSANRSRCGNSFIQERKSLKKEPKFAKLLPVPSKKSNGFSLMFLTRIFTRCFSFMHYNIHHRLVNLPILKTCKRFAMSRIHHGNRVTFFGFPHFRLYIYLHAPRLIVQPEAWDDRHKRRIRTTNRYSI